MALDQSSSVTGWAYYEGEELKEFGKFKSSGYGDYQERLEELIISFSPQTIYYEGIYASGNMATFKVLAHIQGLTIGTAHKHNIETVEVYPSSWKSICKVGGRNRTEQKRAAQSKVIELYGVKATQDESDAILLGHSQKSAF